MKKEKEIMTYQIINPTEDCIQKMYMTHFDN